jgi:transposase
MRVTPRMIEPLESGRIDVVHDRVSGVAAPKVVIPYDPALHKKRHKIENMFGRLKDWRRIHTRYDRCAHTFFSTICIAAAVIFWL